MCCRRVSVRLSQAGVLSKRLSRSFWVSIQRLLSVCSTVCFTRYRVSSEIRVLPSGTLSQILENFVTARQPSQVLSTSVDAECDKLSTVIGRQFITLSVHLCVQHDGREAARCAGLSVAAEICLFLARESLSKRYLDPSSHF